MGKELSLNILEIAKKVKKLEDRGVGTAEDTTYDNTDSGLTAETVQGAIDELAGDIDGLSADDIDYDNTDSGLTADTVQDAIDELAGNIDGLTANDVTYGSGTVKDVLDGLTSNTIGSTVDLSDYDSPDNRYTVPNDGYLYLNAGAQSGSTTLANITDANSQTIGASYASATSIPYVTDFVKKGFKVLDTLHNGGLVYFKPLI